MSTRYGRAQFIKDAARLGLSRDAAFSRAELRRRRDRLMIVHHPDRGGDPRKAARINAIYARMLTWLDARSARLAETRHDARGTPPKKTGRVSALSAGLNASAARVWGLALVAAATYAAIRAKRKA